jgi:preprotein translocase subunit SecG
MDFVIIVLVSLLVLCSLLLVFAVILQNSKGGGLVSSMRGANEASALFGARRAADIVERATWWLAGTFVVLTFAINVIYAINVGDRKAGTDAIDSELENVPTPAQQPSPAPAPAEGQ